MLCYYYYKGLKYFLIDCIFFKLAILLKPVHLDPNREITNYTFPTHR